MASNFKKVLGITKKKSDDTEEDACSYSDPTMFHSTDPPSRNSRGFAQPHYPPPRPQHSPNPQRREATTVAQGKKELQNNDRNSAVEPRRAPPRPNVARKDAQDDDYCDPIDVQRKDNLHPEMSTNKARDDYCEPWDTTKKTDFGNAPRKTSQSDDEHNEYMDPYDTGKDGIIEKRRSRGIGKDFHSKVQHPNDIQKKAINESSQAPDPRMSAASSSDYDMPWEWKKQMQMITTPKTKPAPPIQRPKTTTPGPKTTAPGQKSTSPGQKNTPPGPKTSVPGLKTTTPGPKTTTPGPKTTTPGPKDDYDEPWETKQGYLLKTQPPGAAKNRSPVPLPRVGVNTPNQGKDDLYEQPWDVIDPQRMHTTDNVYETPWEEANGSSNYPRRASQPSMPTTQPPTQQRKVSNSGTGELTDYDTPWEYKNARKYSSTSPLKPPQPIQAPCEINPDLPLDDQSWYHGPIKRLEAEDLLRDSSDCSFLVRNSESSRRDFSLSMKNNDNYLHLKIVRQIDGQFILGQFSKPFMDIPKVINHYSRNKLNIRGAEHKYLKHPIASQPEYHTIEPDEDCHL